MIKRILNIPEYYDFFLERYCIVLDYFNESYLDTGISSDSAMIRPYLVNDLYSDYTISDFDQNINNTYMTFTGIKEFINQRSSEINNSLTLLGVDCSSVINDLGVNEEVNDAIHVYPNPVNGNLWIQSNIAVSKLALFNSVGQNIFQIDLKHEHFSQIDMSDFTPGYYVLRLESNNGIHTKKLIIE